MLCLNVGRSCLLLSKRVTGVAMNNIPRNVPSHILSKPTAWLVACSAFGWPPLSSCYQNGASALSCKGSERLLSGVDSRCRNVSSLSLFPPLSISFHPSLPLPPASLLSFFFQRGQSSACWLSLQITQLSFPLSFLSGLNTKVLQLELCPAPNSSSVSMQCKKCLVRHNRFVLE